MPTKPFALAAREEVKRLKALKTLSATEAKKLKILDYLLANCLGASNAQPWDTIKAGTGVTLSKEGFQQGILKGTRIGDIFIGSNDQDSKGYFIIKNKSRLFGS